MTVHSVRVAVAPFSPGDRVRLDSWAPSEALDNLHVQEEPPPGTEGWVLSCSESMIGRTTHQIDVWWDDRGARSGHTPGRGVFVCWPGDRISVSGQPHEIAVRVAALDDYNADKEWSFVENDIPARDDFEATLWRNALEYEKEKRQSTDRRKARS